MIDDTGQGWENYSFVDDVCWCGHRIEKHDTESGLCCGEIYTYWGLESCECPLYEIEEQNDA